MAEEYGLDVEKELDKVGVKYLGTYVSARTSKQGPDLRIDFDSHNFINKTREEQNRTVLHELIHVKQFNNSLGKWASEEFNVSEEFSDKLDGTICEDVKSIEGETEMILSTLIPEQEVSYPYAKSQKQLELESDGIDAESELMDEIEEEAGQIMDEYREIENIQIEENIYVEEGSIIGEDYTVAVLGEEAPTKGPKQVEEYLTEQVEYKPAITTTRDTGMNQESYSLSSRV